MGLFSKPIKTLDDLFVHTLQDIYYAENQITKNLPTMIEKATSPELKNACREGAERESPRHGVDAPGFLLPASAYAPAPMIFCASSVCRWSACLASSRQACMLPCTPTMPSFAE